MGWSIAIDALDSEPCQVALFLSQNVGRKPHVTAEVRYDPDLCSALEISDEPDLALFSLAQADQLRTALDVLLNQTTDRPIATRLLAA